MTKKLLLFLCILMNLACMMLAALLYSIRSQGMMVAFFLGQSINPTTAIIVLMGLAFVFILLAIRVVATMWRK